MNKLHWKQNGVQRFFAFVCEYIFLFHFEPFRTKSAFYKMKNKFNTQNSIGFDIDLRIERMFA